MMIGTWEDTIHMVDAIWGVPIRVPLVGAASQSRYALCELQLAHCISYFGEGI